MTTSVQGTFGTASPRHTFEYEMILFESYLQDLEAFLTVEANKAEASLVEAQRTWAVDDEDNFEPTNEELDAHGDYADRTEELDRFADILRSSFFVSLYSFLEFEIIAECRRRKTAEISLELKDIAEKGIDQARTYFRKVLGAYFPSDTSEWEEIKHYRDLRNCLVHSRGRLDLPRNPKSLRNYADAKDSLRVEGNIVHLTEEFCVEANEITKTFLSKLLFQNSK